MTRASVLALIVAILGGCNDELAWALPQETLTLQKNGRSCPVTPDSAQFKQLAAWVSQNRSGWSSSPASYVPGTIVRGGNFSINFLNALVVVNHPGGQFTHKASPDDFGFLGCPSGT